MTPASVMTAVPWTSSLNVVKRDRYLPSRYNAVCVPKSSNCISVVRPNRSAIASMNSPTNASYSSNDVADRLCFNPMYRSSFSSCSLSVPTSRQTGRTRRGLIPANATYRASLPIGMPMPFAPRSPRPRMRPPSVKTTTSTSSPGQLSTTLRTAPRAEIGTYRPCGSKYMCDHCWQARPTAGVYTIGRIVSGCVISSM